MSRALLLTVLCTTSLSAQRADAPVSPDPDPAELEPIRESVTVVASPLGQGLELLSAEVFRETLFSRDDQILHLLNGGINAGQHEGGGKSLEIRRFGFNLDHGGANGGLRVTVDDVPQNHSTQGHGQGYLGSLKQLTPELIQDVTLINGPFSAEHGDFSGLGAVEIKLRETMPDVWTVRLQGGAFETARGFLAWSPNPGRRDALFAYEGSHADGPFVKPLNYNRHNVSGNHGWLLGRDRRFGLKWNGGLNDFDSSGQIPIDEVVAGRLDRFGFLSPGDGGSIQQGRLGAYYQREYADGSTLRLDATIERSLFDLFSNFTFYLEDPVNGDAIQQHDSRLSQIGAARYEKTHFVSSAAAVFRAGGSLLASQNQVDMRSVVGRDPFALNISAHAAVTNGAGYVEEQIRLFNGRLRLLGGLRWDVFRYAVSDDLEPEFSGVTTATAWQPKAGVTFSPWLGKGFEAFFNYGRGIASLDARAVVRRPDSSHINTTDFFQWGFSQRLGRRVSLLADLFLIEQSNQLVFIPDDGTIEFSDPSRSYGYEARARVDLTDKLSLDGGVTKVLNAYFRDTEPRVFLDRAPSLTANAALTLARWRGWSGSLRMRAINRYRLDGENPTPRAAGHTVFDLGVSRRMRPNIDLSLAIDNLLDREFWEVQNFFESRLPGQQPRERIHGTPGWGRTIIVGLTFRFGEK